MSINQKRRLDRVKIVVAPGWTELDSIPFVDWLLDRHGVAPDGRPDPHVLLVQVVDLGADGGRGPIGPEHIVAAVLEAVVGVSLSGDALRAAADDLAGAWRAEVADEARRSGRSERQVKEAAYHAVTSAAIGRHRERRREGEPIS